MRIKKFDMNTDFNRVEEYLRNRYFENENMTSWLPQRFNDLVYRLDSQHTDKPGGIASKDFIYLWEDNNEIVACILPDGDAIYMSIKKGCENLFSEMITFAEENHTGLFPQAEDDSVDFLIIANDSLKYRADELEKRGYIKQAEEDYDNYCCPLNVTKELVVPKGYNLVYGDAITDEYAKWSSCDMGFHPEYEKDPTFTESMKAYDERKKSPMYNDSFECLVTTDDRDICSYSFCYVDKKTSTAFIEPVSTRGKYRHKGIGSVMMLGIMLRLKEMKIEKCYVNSYAWRKKFYHSAGFKTEDSIGFWHKKIGLMRKKT